MRVLDLSGSFSESVKGRGVWEVEMEKGNGKIGKKTIKSARCYNSFALPGN